MFVVDFYCLQLKCSQGGHLPLMQWEWNWNLSPVLSNSQSSFSGPCAPGCTGISPRLDSRGQNRQCPCHVILTAVWSIISLQPHFESKNPLGEKIPPPQRDKDFQVEVVQGRDRRSPTLQKLSEKSCRMLCLNYIQVAWLVLSADVRRVSQSALCPTGEPEQCVQWKRKWCKAGNFIYSLSEKILSSKSYSMAKGTNTISSFNLDTGLNKILFETIE